MGANRIARVLHLVVEFVSSWLFSSIHAREVLAALYFWGLGLKPQTENVQFQRVEKFVCSKMFKS